MKNTLFPETARSLVARYVTPERYARLSALKTATGFTLAKAIASGRENPDSSIGIYVGDPETYVLFQEIMDRVIVDYHGMEAPISHPAPLPCDAFTGLDLENPDPEGEFVLTTRIRVARNLARFPFPPHMSPEERDGVRDAALAAVQAFSKDLSGTYYPMDTLSEADLKAAHEKGRAFPKGDRFMEAAGINGAFPRARGIFHAHDGQAQVWVNEEDHLRVVSLERGADMASVFARMGRLLDSLETHLSFAHDPRLGYLSACPTNIGTAMRAGVHIRLPGLETQPEQLNAIAAKHHLQIRGTHGEKTSVEGAVFDISNKHRLGIDEAQIVHTLHKGVTALIQAEKQINSPTRS